MANDKTAAAPSESSKELGIDLGTFDGNALSKLISDTKDHSELKSRIEKILGVDEWMRKLRDIIKDRFSKIERFDASNKEQVVLLQILATSFGLSVYIDWYYGRQTKVAAEEVLRLNKLMDPPAIILPEWLDDSKLASYRKWAAEKKAVEDLLEDFQKVKNDPEKLKVFEKEVESFKLDIQNLKQKHRLETGDIKPNPTKEKKEWAESKDSIPVMLDRILKRLTSLSTIDASYNDKEGKVYLENKANADYPKIFSLSELGLNKSNPDLASLFEKKIAEIIEKTDDFKMPEWASEKRESAVSPADRLKSWESEIPKTSDSMAKAMKLKNIIRRVDALKIESKYKMNIIDKFVNSGQDMTARALDVIAVIEKKNDVIKAFWDKWDDIKRKFIDALLEYFTTFTITREWFVNALRFLTWSDITKWEDVNERYIGNFKKLLSNEIFINKLSRDFAKWKFWTEMLDANNFSFDFIKEYSTFDFASLDKWEPKDKLLQNFLRKVKTWLDRYSLNNEVEAAQEIFEMIKTSKFIDELQVYKNDPELYKSVLAWIADNLQAGKTSYSTLLSLVRNARSIYGDVKKIDIKNTRIQPSKMMTVILKWRADISDIKKLWEVDKEITRLINSWKPNSEYIKSSWKTIIDSIIEWTYSSEKVIKNLSKIADFKEFEKHKEIYSKFVVYLFEKSAPEMFDREILRMQSAIEVLKDDHSLTLMTSEQKFTFLREVAVWRVDFNTFKEIAECIHDVQKKADSWIIPGWQAEMIVTSLISDKETFGSVKPEGNYVTDFSWVSLKKYDAAKRAHDTQELINKKLREYEALGRPLTKDEEADRTSLFRKNDQLNKALEKAWVVRSFCPAKKLSPEDYKFAAWEYSEKKSKWEYKIPEDIFESKSVREWFENAIGAALMAWEIKKSDAEYMFSKLLNSGSPEFAKFKKFTSSDRQDLMTNIISWKLSYDTAWDAWASARWLEAKMSFMLDNYWELDAFDNYPSWADKTRYKEIVLALRQSFLSWYFTTKERLDLLKKDFNEGKLTNLVSNAADWLKFFAEAYKQQFEKEKKS